MTPEELKDIEERHSCLLKGGPIDMGMVIELARPIDMGMVIELARGIGDIGKLLSHIKELESQIPRWIPVEERLPERWVGVIGYSKEYGILHNVWNKDGQWYDEADVLTDITHWQPLPKGPEE